MTVAPPRGTEAGATGKAPDAFRTISEVADELNLPQHVLRFWETRFAQIKPMKRGGGRRYYRPDDVDLLRGIRHLLYSDGYTIKGVQRILKEEGVRFVVGIGHGNQAPPPRSGDIEGPTDGGLALADDPDLAPIEDEDGLEDADRADDDETAAGDVSAGTGEVDGGVAVPAARAAGRNAAARPAARVANPGPAGLSKEDTQALQQALADLLECKRILDQAR